MIERKGGQYRVRIRSPSSFNKKTIRTKDVGSKGGLQLITGRLKGKKNTTVQALRLSANDFKMKNGKLIPKTVRGFKEVKSLVKSNTSQVSKVARKSFSNKY
jgi:hypothetical protein